MRRSEISGLSIIEQSERSYLRSGLSGGVQCSHRRQFQSCIVRVRVLPIGRLNLPPSARILVDRNRLQEGPAGLFCFALAGVPQRKSVGSRHGSARADNTMALGFGREGNLIEEGVRGREGLPRCFWELVGDHLRQ